MLKFTVERADLVRELSLVVGCVDRRSTIPILASVHLAGEGDALQITATDLEVSLQTSCPATVASDGSTTIPAKRLLDYVRMLPEGPICFSVGDTHWVTLTAGRAKARIAGMSAESFPALVAAPLPIATIKASGLARIIKQTAYAISMEESRFTLNGARLELAGGTARMIATDGHRLALAEAPCDAPPKPSADLIPKHALMELAKLAGDAGAEANVEFASDSNHVFFTLAGRTLTALRRAGSFPDYEQVVPKSFSGSAIVDRAALKTAIGRVRNFADERSPALRFTAGPGPAYIELAASAVDTGESNESLDADVTGSIEAGYNADYLLDYLTTAPAERVRISFNRDKDAAQLDGMDGAHRALCVVMPMRI